MALTLVAEQQLGKVGLIEYFEASRSTWVALAKKTLNFIKSTFPTGAIIRQDDVAKELRPLIEVNENLSSCLAAKKLTQKYWFGHFTDLVVDRTWLEINAPETSQ